MRGFLYRRRSFVAMSAAVAVASALPVHVVRAQSVITPIERLISVLLQVMKDGPHTPFQQRFNTLAPAIDETFDLPAILQESVGLSWDSVPEDQKAILEQAFRRYTVASYVNSFDSFDGQRFEVSPDSRPGGNGEQVVETKIIPRTGADHQLDYVMRQSGGTWKVVDVLADGSISRVAVQRSDFRHLLARGGPQALAESLRTKSANLSEGAG